MVVNKQDLAETDKLLYAALACSPNYHEKDWKSFNKSKSISLNTITHFYTAFTVRPQSIVSLKLTESSKACIPVSVLVVSVWKIQR